MASKTFCILAILTIGILILVMELVRQDFDPGGGRHSSFSDIILNSHSTNQLSSQVAKATRRQTDCDFYKCFDINRCSQHSNIIKVHIYPESGQRTRDGVSTLKQSKQYLHILDAIYASEFYTPDPKEACLFIPSIDTLNLNQNRRELEAALSSLEFWNRGKNHLIFNFFGDPEIAQVDQAMIASPNLSTYSYRPVFDISLPFIVPESSHQPSPDDPAPDTHTNQLIRRQHDQLIRSLADRPVSLLVFEDRLDKRILAKVSKIRIPDALFARPCPTGQNLQYCTSHTVQKTPPLSADELRERARFCLVTGPVPGTLSLRLSQTLARGCVPVIVREAARLPLAEVLDWTEFAVMLRQSEVSDLARIIKAVEPRHAALHARLVDVYTAYMASPAKAALTSLRIINSRTHGNHGLSLRSWNLSKATRTPLFLQRLPRPNAGFTAVILTYDRQDSLFQIITQISEVESLQRILVVWNHQTIPPPPAQHWPKTNKPLKVVQTMANRLSNRFYPYAEIETECVFSLDDDINMLTNQEIEFGYQTWREFPDRIVGFPSRLHEWNSSSGNWNYESEWKNQHSLILTGAAFYNNYWSYMYTGAPGHRQPEIRDWVDEQMNCEDISFNFMVANQTSKPNIKVGPRKKYRCVTEACENGSMLSRDSAHLAIRTKCIERLSEIYGGMPLKAVEFRVDPVLYKENVSPAINKFSNIGAL